MPEINDIISAQLAQRKLPQRAVRMSREMMAERTRNAREDPIQMELSPANIAELMTEIQRTTDPRAKAVLQAELDRLRDAASNLQPMPPMPESGGFMNNALEFPGGRPVRTLTDSPGMITPLDRINTQQNLLVPGRPPYPGPGGVRG